jgi:hypothetical protein
MLSCSELVPILPNHNYSCTRISGLTNSLDVFMHWDVETKSIMLVFNSRY